MREATASAEHQAIAATAFTALLDSLWVALVGLLPGDAVPAIPTANLVLGLLGLTSTGG